MPSTHVGSFAEQKMLEILQEMRAQMERWDATPLRLRAIEEDVSKIRVSLATAQGDQDSVSAAVESLRVEVAAQAQNLSSLTDLKQKGLGVLACITFAGSVVLLALGGILHRWLEINWK